MNVVYVQPAGDVVPNPNQEIRTYREIYYGA